MNYNDAACNGSKMTVHKRRKNELTQRIYDMKKK